MNNPVRPHRQNFKKKKKNIPAQKPHCQKNKNVYPYKPVHNAVFTVFKRLPDYIHHILRIKIEGPRVNYAKAEKRQGF
jgi:hypothetical protein